MADVMLVLRFLWALWEDTGLEETPE